MTVMIVRTVPLQSYKKGGWAHTPRCKTGVPNHALLNLSVFYVFHLALNNEPSCHGQSIQIAQVGLCTLLFERLLIRT
jgi:hypothetical protein